MEPMSGPATSSRAAWPGMAFTIVAPWGEQRVQSALPGRHLVPPALAAAAVAERFDVPLADVAAALEAGSAAPHRMALDEMAGGATLVDDTYNASPESVRAALAFLAETPVGRGRRLAVLGDMLELGPSEQALHEAIGAIAAEVLDGLVAVGQRGRWIARRGAPAGLARVDTADDAEHALAVVERVLDPGAGDLLLVKGSRGIALDRLVAALLGRAPDASIVSLDAGLLVLLVELHAEGLEVGDVGVVVVGDVRDHHPVAVQVGAADLLDARELLALDRAELGEVDLRPGQQAETRARRRPALAAGLGCTAGHDALDEALHVLFGDATLRRRCP